jgi:hypothetical protein
MKTIKFRLQQMSNINPSDHPRFPVIDLDGEFIGMAVNEHGARHALKLMLSSVIGLPVSDDEIGRVPFVDGRWVIGARSRQNPV